MGEGLIYFVLIFPKSNADLSASRVAVVFFFFFFFFKEEEGTLLPPLLASHQPLLSKGRFFTRFLKNFK